jgi:hypothetical protein
MLGYTDILNQLRIDPGQRTLGELLQDREAALHEIRLLRREIERLRHALEDQYSLLIIRCVSVNSLSLGLGRVLSGTNKD